MLSSDISRMERELGITLPEAYKRTLRNYPIPAFAGNSEIDLWDDADALLALNRELRAGTRVGVKPWPAHMFALGHAGDGCPVAIDLRNPAAPVWWVENCALDGPSSGPTQQSYAEWLEQYVLNTRHDLEGDEIDPDGSPAARERSEKSEAGKGCLARLTLLVIVILVIVGVMALMKQF